MEEEQSSCWCPSPSIPLLLLSHCLLHLSLSPATATVYDLQPTAPSNRLPDRCLFFLLCRCILQLFPPSAVTPSHCHRRCHAATTLFLYWKHVAASSGGSNPLLAGIYSSTSGGPLSSTPSYAPSLYTSPSTTEAEQMQLFSHLFFAVI
ncbi:hypothetical protein GW17_00042116 [Ensete ventricosum]|nr:hypothetical protein GW17_00042116 [Ensete ventricosum]RZR97377.1 hypothetical protein BHM03_00026549 [Ensete ventricosum]